MNCCEQHSPYGCTQGRDCPVRKARVASSHLANKAAHDAYLAKLTTRNGGRHIDTGPKPFTLIDNLALHAAIAVVSVITCLVAFGAGCWFLGVHRDDVERIFRVVTGFLF